MSLTEQEMYRMLDRIYDMEDLFPFEETWDYINEVLAHVDVETTDPTFIVAYINVTRILDQHLPARKPLIAAFHKKYPRYRNIK